MFNTVLLIGIAFLLLGDIVSKKTCSFPTEEIDSYNTVKINSQVRTIQIPVWWIGNPSNATFTIYDEKLEKLDTIETSNLSIEGEGGGRLYIKSAYTAHFLEGGTETRYIWFLVEFNESLNNSLTYDLAFEPADWPEEPQLKW